ncbi:YggT family protein [Kibdelosporangium aridum]|uniref:YggT family protein n=1 Tax=Kibdelosporangium aridum TaxID=2030 RepID=A0A1W2FS41_KIBAR|nr:YggT family protein [Kibdelosporangium aridum]SMD24436.1 YggT family protein [Kibdelosporangium aridum]
MSALGTLLGLVLTLFIVVMVIRAILDWVGVLSSGGAAVIKARRVAYGLTEPVIRPVRRLMRPARVGSVSIDLAFTVVFVAAVILRALVSNL